ncbi:hypothetical protein MLD38_032419 [Melastoma candidum]|uniref:Uncharacterized protein n=1 Tax=Melastoma candidum TaxID=119954 RepID=A0ACB9M3G0_9MYRT|nr:hypothetical protein MLD38_032419 [Melastoma candidum]
MERDVFLSFRGEDNHGRGDFVGHLNTALNRAGITTFFADESLKIGQDISCEIRRAIENSRIAIVVLSENFPSSRWCLDELVKICECKEARGLAVKPVFYNVEPSDVRRLNGRFGDAFKESSKRAVRDGTPERVEKWGKALNEVGNLMGWESTKWREPKLISRIVRLISMSVSNAFSNITSYTVGIDRRAKFIEDKLEIGSTGTRKLGIWGMSGLGKTTTALFVYEKVCHQFSASSFIADVGKVSKSAGGMATLQKQLLVEILEDESIEVFNNHEGRKLISRRLRHLDILLVVDGVDTPEQLRDLVGDPGWFGPKSRIIITTTDKHLLMASGVDYIYEVEILGMHDARTLFQNYAHIVPEMVNEEYESLSKEVLRYCGGIPLALEVLGSFFAARGPEEWRSALDQLKVIPNKDILARLKISYDGLNDEQKKTFLYVSCILERDSEDHVVFLLDCLGLYPKINLEVLKEKCLVKLSWGRIRMHGKLQELGRCIAHQHHANEHLVLWSIKDIQNLLDRNAVSSSPSKVVCYSLHAHRTVMKHSLALIYMVFAKFPLLKLLIITGGEANFFGHVESLSNELRYIRWDGCPLKSLPSNFRATHLRGLVLPSSSIHCLKSGGEHFARLEVIQLCECEDLTGIPDVSNLPELRTLDLQGCIRLVEVRSSIPFHGKLQHINLKGCTKLRRLPDAIKFPSLGTFTLSGCSSLHEFPQITGRMEHLRELNLDGTAIAELPASIKFLVGLQKLSANDCENLRSLPNCIADLNCLRYLDLLDCHNLKDLPPNLVNLEQVRLKRVREEPEPVEGIQDAALSGVICGTPLHDNAKRCSCLIM